MDIKVNRILYKGIEQIQVPTEDGNTAIFQSTEDRVSTLNPTEIFNGTAKEIDDVNGEINGEISTRFFRDNDVIQTINLPEATKVQNEGMYSCGNLKSVSMAKCTTLNYRAFRDCGNLITANFPECITVGQEAFYADGNLLYANFPKAETVGPDGFGSCSKIEVLDLPNVVSLDNASLANCSKLETLNIPKVTKILGNDVFSGSNSLPTTITFPLVTEFQWERYTFRGSIFKQVTLPIAPYISYRTFRDCGNLEVINIPECTYIYEEGFYNCPKLTTVNAPKVATINRDAFGQCKALVEIHLPEVTKLNGNAIFAGCTALETFDLPKLTTLIGNDLFSNTPALPKSFTFPLVNSFNWEHYIFRGSNFTEVTFTVAHYMSKRTFRDCSNIERVNLPNCYDTIYEEAFYNSPKFETLVLNSDDPCALNNTNALYNTVIANSTEAGFIYVPLRLYRWYKARINWRNYEAKFRPLQLLDNDIKNLYIIRFSGNTKPKYTITSESTIETYDNLIIAEANTVINYTLKSDGYQDISGTYTLSGTDRINEVTIEFSNMTPIENYNGVTILNYNFNNLEIDYSNLGTINFDTYPYHQYYIIEGNGKGITFAGDRYFTAAVTHPDLTTYTNPTYVLEFEVGFTVSNDNYSTVYCMVSNNMVGLRPTELNYYNSGTYKYKVGGHNLVSGDGENYTTKHIAYVITPTQFITYIDGELADTVTGGELYTNIQSSSIYIGFNPKTTNDTFKGYMKSLALTVEDIEDPANAYFVLFDREGISKLKPVEEEPSGE